MMEVLEAVSPIAWAQALAIDAQGGHLLKAQSASATSATLYQTGHASENAETAFYNPLRNAMTGLQEAATLNAHPPSQTSSAQEAT